MDSRSDRLALRVPDLRVPDIRRDLHRHRSRDLHRHRSRDLHRHRSRHARSPHAPGYRYSESNCAPRRDRDSRTDRPPRPPRIPSIVLFSSSHVSLCADIEHHPPDDAELRAEDSNLLLFVRDFIDSLVGSCTALPVGSNSAGRKVPSEVQARQAIKTGPSLSSDRPNIWKSPENRQNCCTQQNSSYPTIVGEGGPTSIRAPSASPRRQGK
jgi:hypothetical protein